MIVERIDNEIVIRMSSIKDPKKIQAILDYLQYEDLTSKSEVSCEESEGLLSDAKRGRLARVKKEIGLDD